MIILVAGLNWAILLAKLTMTTNVLQLDVLSSLVKLITIYAPSENSTPWLKMACYISVAIIVLLGIYCIPKCFVSAQLGAWMDLRYGVFLNARCVLCLP